MTLLRCSLCAEHTAEQVETIVGMFERAGKGGGNLVKSLYDHAMQIFCLCVVCVIATGAGCTKRSEAQQLCATDFQHSTGQTFTVRADIFPAGGSMEYYHLAAAHCAKRVNISPDGLPIEFVKKYMTQFVTATRPIAVEGDFTIRIEWTDRVKAVGRVLSVKNDHIVDFQFEPK